MKFTHTSFAPHSSTMIPSSLVPSLSHTCRCHTPKTRRQNFQSLALCHYQEITCDTINKAHLYIGRNLLKASQQGIFISVMRNKARHHLRSPADTGASTLHWRRRNTKFSYFGAAFEPSVYREILMVYLRQLTSM